MEKDFREWCDIKEKIETKPIDNFLYCKQREIWMCSLGVNIGSEQDGQGFLHLRPIIIFKTFNKKMFWGIPTTTKSHQGPHHFEFNLGGVDQFAILSQIRLFSTKRLTKRMVVMPESIFNDLVEVFIKILPKNEISPERGEIVADTAIVT